MDLVQVVNLNTTDPLILRHDLRGDILIPPGGERIVSWAYVAVAFGDPRVSDPRERSEIYANLLTRWGHYPGIDTAEGWAANGPKYSVKDMDGQEIHMILDDPRGTASNPALGNDIDLGDKEAVSGEIAAMKEQIERLQRIIEAGAGAPQAAVPSGSSDPVPAPEGLPDAATANTESQESRNEARDDIPKPKARVVKQDKPTSSRVGAK